MSLLQASKIGAEYDPIRKLLILGAEVELTRVTYGIVFRRFEPWTGGYKFALEGFQTTPQPPVTVPTTRSIPTPDDRSLLKTIIVCSVDYPKGEVIPVHWLGVGTEAPKDAGQERTAAPESHGPDVIHTVVPIKELLHEPFRIEARANNEFVYLDSFDDRFLQLQNASIINGNIVWTFLPLITGHTTVRITSEKALGGPVFAVEYMIDIVLPTQPEQPDTKSIGENGETLGYLGRVQVLLNNVKKTHPDAVVHSAKALTHNQSGVESIGELFDLFVTFHLPGENKFLYKQMIGEYIIASEKIGPAYLGVPDVIWPCEFQAEDALKELRARKVDDAFVQVELTMTVEHGDEHFPSTWLYIFYLADGSEERVQLLQSKQS